MLTRWILTAAVVGLLAGCDAPAKPKANPIVREQFAALDGETVSIDGRAIRLAGIVAPALPDKAHCWAEAMAGRHARDWLNGMFDLHGDYEILPDATATAQNGVETGRVVLKPEGGGLGRDLSNELLTWGLVAPAGGRPVNWCGPVDPTAPGAKFLLGKDAEANLTPAL